MIVGIPCSRVSKLLVS